MEEIKNFIKAASNWHQPVGRDNIMIVSTPRSGSTWLMELIWSQPGFKTCNEPLNIRRAAIRKASGIKSWEELYTEDAKPKLSAYLWQISNGGHRFLNPSPLRKHYRPLSNRIVFKIINGGEPWINDLAVATRSRVIYLIRHPFSVSLSRKKLPRLEALCSDQVLNRFPKRLAELCKKVCDKGNPAEQAVLSWSIQNKLALMNRKSDWLVFTYEQLVMDPEPILSLLTANLMLPKRNKILEGLRRPSAVTVQSKEGTGQLIQSANGEDLIHRWKKDISTEQASRLWDIIKAFELGIFNQENSQPTSAFLVP